MPTAQDLERLQEQTDIATASGFSSPKTWFAVGTKVIEVGARNFQLSREKFEKLPLLADALNGFNERIAQEDRLDSLPKDVRHDMAMAEDGALVNGGGNRFLLTPRSLQQLIYRTGFPEASAAATYLASIPAARRAPEVTALLKGAKEGRTAVLRTRKVPGHKEREIYAVVSERYTTGAEMDVIAQAMLATEWPGEARGTVMYDGDRMALGVQWHSDIQPETACVGEWFRANVSVKARDDGGAGVAVDTGATRAICINLTKVDVGKNIGSLRHQGDYLELVASMQGLIADAKDSMKGFAELWDRARQIRLDIADTIRDLPMVVSSMPRDQVVKGLYRGLITERKLALPGMRTELGAQRLTDSWAIEPEFTRAGIVNGITRAAHEGEQRSVWGGEALEQAAGELLKSTRPFNWVGSEE